MNISADGTTLRMDAHYLQQLFLVRDRFRDRREGSARIQHDDGRSYRVHLYANHAFRIVHPTDGDSYCVWTTLKYNPREIQGETSSCTISSNTQRHSFITLPSAGVLRAAILSEEEMPMYLVNAVLARVCSLPNVAVRVR